MSTYRFSDNERYAILKVFDFKCQWCGAPLEFKNNHIDHLLPEVLLKRPDELKEILESYGLDEGFDLNDFENWIPLHPSCNTRKNDAVYKRLPIIKTILDRCASKKEEARKIKIKLDREPKKSEIITKIKVAIEHGVINHEDLQEFINTHKIEEIGNESVTEIKRLISLGIIREADRHRWKVAKTLNDDELLVTDGEKTGVVPRASTPHISWLCPNCFTFGPWDGVRCLSCGRLVDPG